MNSLSAFFDFISFALSSLAAAISSSLDATRASASALDLFGRGIDIERVNIVVNYDFPEVKEGNAPTVASDQYLHRVGRAGRFGTKGLAISFISSKEDADILAQVQSRFEVDVSELPDQIDISSYMNS